jgi:hypothetical protein
MLFLQFLIGATALPDKVLRLEAAYPAVFYTFAWLVLLELSVMFTDLRHFAVDAVQIAKM